MNKIEGVDFSTEIEKCLGAIATGDKSMLPKECVSDKGKILKHIALNGAGFNENVEEATEEDIDKIFEEE